MTHDRRYAKTVWPCAPTARRSAHTVSSVCSVRLLQHGDALPLQLQVGTLEAALPEGVERDAKPRRVARVGEDVVRDDVVAPLVEEDGGDDGEDEETEETTSQEE